MDLKLLAQTIRNGDPTPETADLEGDLNELVDALEALDAPSIEFLMNVTGGKLEQAKKAARYVSRVFGRASESPPVKVAVSEEVGLFSLANEVMRNQLSCHFTEAIAHIQEAVKQGHCVVIDNDLGHSPPLINGGCKVILAFEKKMPERSPTHDPLSGGAVIMSTRNAEPVHRRDNVTFGDQGVLRVLIGGCQDGVGVMPEFGIPALVAALRQRHHAD